MTALAAALEKAGVVSTTPAAGDSPKQEPKKRSKDRVDIRKKSRGNKGRGKWGTAGRPNIVEWSHSEMGDVYIELKQFALGSIVYQEGPNTWCRINLGGHKPSVVELDFNYKLNENVELLHARGTRVINTANDEPLPFVIAIEWKPGPKKDSLDVPHLPQGYEQDFQLFLVNKKTGLLIELEITWVSRNGVLWLTVQEKVGVQAIWHQPDLIVEDLTSVEVGERAYTLVPVYNENCYPGFDPVASMNRSYPERADKVLGYIAEWGAAISAEECSPGSWQPQWPVEVPAELKNKGYHKAVVTWFNLTLGYGFLELEDGQSCFVHFKAIQDETGKFVAEQGEFPVLQGGKGVYAKYMLKPDKSGEKKPAATAVRLAVQPE